MFRTSRREFTIALIVAALISMLYRYWLVYPILRSLSLGQWRWVAVSVAAAIGATCSLLGLPMRAIVTAAVVGLLSGGTWAALFIPTDVRVTVYSAFASHLESFWREVIILTIVIALSTAFVSRFSRPRSH